MCTNYEPFLDPTFRNIFGAEIPPGEFNNDAYIQYLAPVVRNIVRKSDDEPRGREALAAHFGLVPYWFQPKPETPDKIVPSWATHNARLETIGQFNTELLLRIYFLILLIPLDTILILKEESNNLFHFFTSVCFISYLCI